jgi:hypothetical protein
VIGLDVIDKLTGGRHGTFDVACPECGPLKQSACNRRRTVLRVYRIDSNFAGYHCARCGEKGAAVYRKGRPPAPEILFKARMEAAERDRTIRAERLSKAVWLWRHRQPIRGSIAETYLRSVRGYGGPLPATLGFLPERRAYPPAMIAAFGLAHEVEPGVIAIANSAVTGVHLTRLKSDGSGKAVFDDPDENAKIMIGYSAGSPIVLAPPNDLLGLGITEGIEDGLAVHESTGLCVWAAGCASRLPTLAQLAPSWCDCITVLADDDTDGRRYAAELAHGLHARDFDTRLIILNAARWAA